MLYELHTIYLYFFLCFKQVKRVKAIYEWGIDEPLADLTK